MRIKTGIPGLDTLTGGGFLEGSSVLIGGGAGTGKTILSTQYIYKGAEEFNEPGIYITLEEGATNIWWNMKNFKWNLTKFEEKGLIKLYRIGMLKPQEFAHRFEEEIDTIKDMVQEMDAKRLVVDSTTAFGMWMANESELRYALFKLSDELKELKCTTLMTTETLGQRDQLSRFGVEEFISDSVVALYFKPPMRFIHVRKMRGSDHDKKIHPYVIGSTGITVNEREEVLWESLKE